MLHLSPRCRTGGPQRTRRDFRWNSARGHDDSPASESTGGAAPATGEFIQSDWYAPDVGIVKRQAHVMGSNLPVELEEELVTWDGITAGSARWQSGNAGVRGVGGRGESAAWHCGRCPL